MPGASEGVTASIADALSNTTPVACRPAMETLAPVWNFEPATTIGVPGPGPALGEIESTAGVRQAGSCGAIAARPA